MNNSERFNRAYFGESVNTGNADSRNSTVYAFSEESTMALSAFDVEADNMEAVPNANLEIPVEVNTTVNVDKVVQCATAEFYHESLGNAVGVESSLDTTISCEIVGDPKVYVCPTILQLLTVHNAEVPNEDREVWLHNVPTFAAASLSDDAEELGSLFNVNTKPRNDESENVLPCDSDSGMRSASADAANAGTEETECTVTVTDDDVQLQDTFGTDIDDLPIMRSDAQIPALREGDNVVVLYDLEDRSDHPTDIPGPYPCSLNKDNSHMWDRDYAQMPYAADNWQKVAMVLNQLTGPIHSWISVEDAIKQYHEHPEAIDFSGLRDYFYKKDDNNSLLSRTCLLDLIPKIAKLAADLPNICTRPIRLLRRQKNFVVAMSQYQAACLLANAFFCTYPPTVSSELPVFNFLGLFRRLSRERCASQHAKLDCIFNYFRRVTINPPTGVIMFRRQVGLLISF